jgi:hypothetical protein
MLDTLYWILARARTKHPNAEYSLPDEAVKVRTMCLNLCGDEELDLKTLLWCVSQLMCSGMSVDEALRKLGLSE